MALRRALIGCWRLVGFRRAVSVKPAQANREAGDGGTSGVLALSRGHVCFPGYWVSTCARASDGFNQVVNRLSQERFLTSVYEYKSLGCTPRMSQL